MYKRKRQSRGFTPRKRYNRFRNKKSRSKRMYRKKMALRTVTSAMETKRRYFYSGNLSFRQNGPVGTLWKAVYQPFNWFNVGSGDSNFTGNGIFIRSFQLRGSLAGVADQTGSTYAGPMTFYIYLVKARDEINTGSVVEAWTDASSTVNTWFNATTLPSTWFVNNSKCQIICRKKIVYNPDLNNGFDGLAPQTNAENQRAPKSINFYIKKNINKMHYFRENTGGNAEAGNFGRNFNYYWLIACEQALGWSDVEVRMQVTHLTTFKDN